MHTFVISLHSTNEIIVFSYVISLDSNNEVSIDTNPFVPHLFSAVIPTNREREGYESSYVPTFLNEVENC